MLKLIIIDDEEKARETTAGIIKLYGDNITIVAEAEDVKSGIKAIEEFQPDVVLLDVQMPDGTGFDLLKKLDKINFKVIFITAYQEHAIKAFKFSALDYLLKPVDPDELIAAINVAESAIQQQQLGLKLEAFLSNNTSENKTKIKKIALKTANDIYVVNIEDLIRCEADGNYTTVYLNNGKKIVVSKTLKDYEEILEDIGFFRSHHAHLINLNYFDRFHKADGGFVIMKDGAEVPVSNRKKDQLLKLLEGLNF